VILRDVGLDRWQVRDLMAARRACHPPAARWEPTMAMPTRVRKDVDHGIHALGWDHGSAMARMAGLGAWFAATLRATGPAPVAGLPSRPTTGASRRSSSSAGVVPVAVRGRQSASLARRSLCGGARSLCGAVRSLADHPDWAATQESPTFVVPCPPDAAAPVGDPARGRYARSVNKVQVRNGTEY
jgi:hypothetical protein